MKQHIVCIGECMMELQLHNLKSHGFAFGGDTYNTAFAIKQCALSNSRVSFLSALGNDEFSQQMLEAWQLQGIDTQYISISSDRLPGLYISKTDPSGERSFNYWRNESAARDLFQSDRFPTMLQILTAPECLYFSGVSLAIMSEANRKCLLNYAKLWAESGCQVIFDSNYREQLWSSIDEARQWIDAAWEVASIGLPTLTDEQQLFGIDSAEKSIAKLRAAGVTAGAVKLGEDGCLAFDPECSFSISAPDTIKVVDTTGAGDAFNGAFIASYFENGNSEMAGMAGVSRASDTIQHFGALPVPA